MTKAKIIGAVVAIIAVVIVGVAMYRLAGPLLGGAVHYVKESFVEGLYVGTSRQVEIDRDGRVTLGSKAEGTCNLEQASAGSHAASTSKEYYCAVTGVSAGDTVSVILPPGAGAYSYGAASVWGGFVVNSAYATSSGLIGVSILNSTGAATSSATQATTSAHYLVID